MQSARSGLAWFPHRNISDLLLSKQGRRDPDCRQSSSEFIHLWWTSALSGLTSAKEKSTFIPSQNALYFKHAGKDTIAFLTHRRMLRLQDASYLILIFMIFQTEGLRAQSHKMTFEHFDHDDGLSAPVTRIVQDSIGFLWLGTTDGLNRFDGENFVVFRNIAGDSTSLPNNIINDLSVDPHGRVWAATNGGLCYYDFADNAFQVVKYNDTLENIDRHRVHAVTNARNEGMWFATKTVVHHLDVDWRTKSYPLPDADNMTIKYLFLDKSGLVWIGTNIFLFVLDPNTSLLRHTSVTSAFTRERNLTTTIHPILPFRGDTLLTGSWYGGVHKVLLEKDSILCISLPDDVETSLRRHVVRGICQRIGTIYWVGTYGNGLSLLDASTGRFAAHYHSDPADKTSLSSEYIYDVFTDASGILWVGTDEGLDKFDPLTQQFRSISIPVGSHEFSVYFRPGSIIEDMYDPGKIWLTVSGVGLFQYRPSTEQFILYQHDPNQPNSLPDNAVHVVYQDLKGRIWLGMSSGLSLFDSTRSKFITTPLPDSISTQGVHRISQDEKGVFWFSTQNNGVFSFDEATGQVKSYQYSRGSLAGLPDNRVFCLLNDSRGDVWIGTQNKGLCRLNPKTGEFLYFEHKRFDPNTIPDNGIYDLYEDEISRLWIATENGLAFMNMNDFSVTRYSTRDGLCNNIVYSITPDAQGFLWLSTSNGLSRFDPAKGTFKNYYTYDGLPANHMSGATLFARDGTLYLGSSGMITVCRPEMMLMNARIPEVVITDFRIFDQQAIVDRVGREIRPIHLSHRDNMVTFDFTALNFTNAQFNQYAYKLEGFDDQWIYCGTKQSATFTNLDGGRYIFHVKAANNDGVWNEAGASVQLIVHPPYWETWWFYLLCVILAGSILFGLYRFRIYQLMKLQQIRGRISRDLHDDIGSTLSSINMISSMAAQTSPDARKAGDLFGTIAQASREAMELMSDIVWSINPKNDRMEMVLIRMRQYASETLEAAQIAFTLEMDEACKGIAVPMEQRKDFYLIFKEAINNIAKYSKAHIVKIQLELKGSSLEMRIVDDGVGFDPGTVSIGNGLRNMKARATQLKASFTLTSGKMQGTQVVLALPVSP